jgi:predicted nucleic acid-binding protein
MAFLVDTSVLGRLANTADPFYPIALRAVTELHHAGETLHSTPQVLIEFRNAATRPLAVNGLGLDPIGAEKKAALFATAFPLLPDTPDIFPAWKSLVHTGGVIGKQVHDARIVAICRVHRITNLLTFNVAHLARLARFEPGLSVVDPSTV